MNYLVSTPRSCQGKQEIAGDAGQAAAFVLPSDTRAVPTLPRAFHVGGLAPAYSTGLWLSNIERLKIIDLVVQRRK